MENVKYIEDCLLILAGMHPSIDKTIPIINSDKSLLVSFAKQINKGLGLTDRQHDLAKQKLDLYRDIFKHTIGIDINEYKDKLLNPIREIDRSQYVKITEINDEKFIEIRFPFNKTKIMIIQDIKNELPNSFYTHNKGEKKHFFKLHEKSIFECIDKLIEKQSFIIDADLIEAYKKLKIMKDNHKKYLPGVYNFQLHNMNNKAIDYIINDVGETPNEKNLALYYDRASKYGIEYFDEDELEKSLKALNHLSQAIIKRKHPQIFISNEKFNLDHLVLSLWELNRFPIIVMMDSMNALNLLHEAHNSFRNLFLNSEQCVLFRLDNDKNKEFNDYIKDNNLNNKLDKNIKIVYINEKVPKPLIKSNWACSTILRLGETNMSSYRIKNYFENFDLVINYEKDPSMIFNRLYKTDNI